MVYGAYDYALSIFTPIYKCLIIYNVKHGGFRRTAAEIRSEL